MKQQIGRYEIIRELGRGSMGIVYSAIDPLIGRMVAIKTIRLDEQGNAESRAELTRRLYREAQSAGILSHPGIITIHDVGDEGDVAYIVMEYVDGTNLEQVLASGVPQHSGTLFTILTQAADALDYAHGKGIIHRDIKPSNIMICQNGTVKIADFGVAKLSASASMTQAGLVLGTPSYMSPEQAQGLAITGHTDQFSLAVVSYRALSGVLPFQGPTLTAILTKILVEEPHYESVGLRAGLQSVFKKALAKNPEARFRNCADFVLELKRAYTLREAERPGSASGAGEPEAATADLNTASEAAARPVSDILPEAASAAPVRPHAASKTKLPLIAWGACLAVLALAAVAFFSFKMLQKSGAPDQHLQTNTTAAVKPAQPDQAEPAPFVAPQAKPSPAVIPAPAPVNGSASEKSVSAKPKPAEAAKAPARIKTGDVVWTGKLEKNSILVISQGKASIGDAVGELPGVPISVELDPADLVVRQKPGPKNQWKRIILYSGSNKYQSITIHWKTLR